MSGKTGASPEPRITLRGWVNRMPAIFFDARQDLLGIGKPIGHRKGWLLAILEGLCRDKSFCWASNAELAAAYGCTARPMQELLAEMERDGIIRRVATAGKRHGIVLLRRANPDLPVAHEGGPQDMERDMRDEIETPEGGQEAGPIGLQPTKKGSRHPRCFQHAHHAENSAPPTLKTAPPTHAENSARNKDVGVKDSNDEFESAGMESGTLQRQRSADPPAPPTVDPRHLVSGLAQAAAPGRQPADPDARPSLRRPRSSPSLGPSPRAEESLELTPSQGQWLAGLAPEQRERFESLPPKSRRMLLAPHAAAVSTDPLIAKEAARVLAPPSVPAEAPAPATTEGLWASLRGGPPHWAQVAAEDLVRTFGSEKDRELWPAFHAIAQAVWRGDFPAEAVVAAIGEAKKPAVRNAGAMFNSVIQSQGWTWR